MTVVDNSWRWLRRVFDNALESVLCVTPEGAHHRQLGAKPSAPPPPV